MVFVRARFTLWVRCLTDCSRGRSSPLRTLCQNRSKHSLTYKARGMLDQWTGIAWTEKREERKAQQESCGSAHGGTHTRSSGVLCSRLKGSSLLACISMRRRLARRSALTLWTTSCFLLLYCLCDVATSSSVIKPSTPNVSGDDIETLLWGEEIDDIRLLYRSACGVVLVAWLGVAAALDIVFWSCDTDEGSDVFGYARFRTSKSRGGYLWFSWWRGPHVSTLLQTQCYVDASHNIISVWRKELMWKR